MLGYFPWINDEENGSSNVVFLNSAGRQKNIKQWKENCQSARQPNNIYAIGAISL